MYRGLLSRMLVMALLVAVIAKPCMGLMVGQANASGLAIAVSDDICSYRGTHLEVPRQMPECAH